MIVVGLTGGIGSGKSTLAVLLAERGAQVIDADLLGHDAVRPGRPAWHSIVDQFGDEVLVPATMEIDRRRLAEIVFSNKTKLAALNAIVHPVIVKGIADALERLVDTDEIVILDAALIVELGLDATLDHLIVVQASEPVRQHRLMRTRGMALDAIKQRIGAQSSPEELLAKADIVVQNDGSLEDLAAEADRVWKELERLRP
ncbi:MAG: dephospho-CoA kinase [Actinomycetota bacterium]